jgi:hypothetical protein
LPLATQSLIYRARHIIKYVRKKSVECKWAHILHFPIQTLPPRNISRRIPTPSLIIIAGLVGNISCWVHGLGPKPSRVSICILRPYPHGPPDQTLNKIHHPREVSMFISHKLFHVRRVDRL